MKLMSLDRSGLSSVQHAYQYGHCVVFVWPVIVSFRSLKYVLMLFPLFTIGVRFCQEDGKTFLLNIACNFSVDFTLHLAHILQWVFYSVFFRIRLQEFF